MDVLQTVAAIALVLVVVVVVHEAGHFLLAKWSGIRVDEFAVGFGPRIWSRVRGDTLYALRLIPAGGFVRMAGMTGLEGEADAGDRNFYRASIPRRGATILAGGVFNLVFAGIIAGIVAMPAQASAVPSTGPLYQAGLRDGDTILQVGSVRIDTSDQSSVVSTMHQATDATRGRPTEVVYRDVHGTVHRTLVHPYLQLINLNANNPLPQVVVVETVNGRPVQPGDPAQIFGGGAPATVTGHTFENPSTTLSGTVDGVTTAAGSGDVGRIEAGWRLGIAPGYDGNSLPYALGRGFSSIPTTIGATFKGLYEIATTPNSGGLQGNVQGPVGIIRDTASQAQAGWLALLSWIGFLSLNLGLFNLLPIPFLDGGRFVFIMLEAVRRRRVDPRREMAIHYAGLMLIFMLVIFVTIGDIRGHS